MMIAFRSARLSQRKTVVSILFGLVHCALGEIGGPAWTLSPEKTTAAIELAPGGSDSYALTAAVRSTDAHQASYQAWAIKTFQSQYP
jgi:hypothetical protein